MAQKPNLDDELAFYERHKAEYLKHFPSLFVLIKGSEMSGPYPTAEAAYEDGLRRYGLRPFLVKQVLEYEPVGYVPLLSLSPRRMPVYNHYYPDKNNQINTPESIMRLMLQGPTVPVAIGVPTAALNLLQSADRPDPAPVSGLALIDTGASFCCIDEAAVRSLNIPPFGTTPVSTPSGSSQQLTYPASLSFPGTTLPTITFTDFIGSPLQAMGIIALIGRTVLRSFVLVYNGPGGSVSLAY